MLLSYRVAASCVISCSKGPKVFDINKPYIYIYTKHLYWIVCSLHAESCQIIPAQKSHKPRSGWTRLFSSPRWSGSVMSWVLALGLGVPWIILGSYLNLDKQRIFFGFKYQTVKQQLVAPGLMIRMMWIATTWRPQQPGYVESWLGFVHSLPHSWNEFSFDFFGCHEHPWVLSASCSKWIQTAQMQQLQAIVMVFLRQQPWMIARRSACPTLPARQLSKAMLCHPKLLLLSRLSTSQWADLQHPQHPIDWHMQSIYVHRSIGFLSLFR